MDKQILMANLSWVDYQERVQNGKEAVLLPIGAIEQHGPHLPLATDLLIAEAIAKRCADAIGVIVAPTITYGCKSQCRSGGGNHFCGTTSLDAKTLIDHLVDVVREFARHGVRKLGLVDIHYENDMYVLEACDVAIRELKYAGVTDFKIVKPNVNAILDLERLRPFYPEGFSSIALEHAGKLETSVMLYLHPELVQQDRYPPDVFARFPPYDAFPPETQHVPPSGALCPTSGACRELGETVIVNLVDGCTAAFRQGLAL